MTHADCQILFDAGKALLAKSGLAHFDGQHFVACNDKPRFDSYWEAEFHPEFGRYMAWVLFSVGAENLAKAACVCNGKVKVAHKPRLGHYLGKHFKNLCRDTGLGGSGDENTLIGGYKQLREVRDRDAHSYHKNVRDADFPRVEKKFVPAFNILAKAMKLGGHPPAGL